MTIKRTILFLFLYATVAFIFYGRALPYSFVYDDHSKLRLNPAMNSLSTSVRAVWDRDVQSVDPGLNTHTYRPLFSILMSIQKKLWGLNPMGYRAVNVIGHVLNAVLVSLLATSLFGLSLSGAFLSGLLFLMHPAQVESVVWIIEFSNVAATVMILFAMLCWNQFLNSMASFTRNNSTQASSWYWYAMAFFFTATGLGLRETTAVLPFVFALISFFKKQLKLTFLIAPALLVAAALAVRSTVLGTFIQVSPMDSSMFHHISMIASVWMNALQFLLIPFPSTINHGSLWLFNPTTLESILSWGVLGGTLMFFFLGLYKNARWGVLWMLVLICWAPTSQVFPLAKLFAERFLYPVMIPLAILMSLGIMKLRSVFKIIVAGFIVVTWGILTWAAIPTWKNDVTLWTHAANTSPDDAINWFNLAEAEKMVASYRSQPVLTNRRGQKIQNSDVSWALRAETYYKKALKIGLPNDQAGLVFISLADINLRLGHIEQASEHARRGLELNPALTTAWQHLKTEYSESQPTFGQSQER